MCDRSSVLPGVQRSRIFPQVHRHFPDPTISTGLDYNNCQRVQICISIWEVGGDGGVKNSTSSVGPSSAGDFEFSEGREGSWANFGCCVLLLVKLRTKQIEQIAWTAAALVKQIALIVQIWSALSSSNWVKVALIEFDQVGLGKPEVVLKLHGIWTKMFANTSNLQWNLFIECLDW